MVESQTGTRSSQVRARAIGTRWIEVFLLALLATLAVLGILWLIAPWLIAPQRSPAWLQGLGYFLSARSLMNVLVLMAGICLLNGLGNGLPSGFLAPWFRLRTLLVYPRLWMSALLSAAFLLWSLGSGNWLAQRLGLPESTELFSPSWANGGLWFLLILFGISVVAWSWPLWEGLRSQCWSIIFDRRDPKEGNSSNVIANEPVAGLRFSDFQALRNWLKDDSPVEKLGEDRFDHRGIAGRMAGRLCKDPIPSQAVVGPLGSGKTTLGKLVRDALAERGESDRIRLVQVELWPFTTPEAAIEGILQALLSAFRRDVSITGLRMVPEHYWEAVSEMGGFWSALGRLLRGPWEGPRELLDRLDQTATAIGMRYVLWVEDLERFAGTSSNLSEETPEQAQILAPIRALLNGLARCHSLSVITATTSLFARFDLEKIALFVEPIPRLPEEEGRQILELFRRSCTTEWKQGPVGPNLIDPGKDSVPRREFDGAVSSQHGSYSGQMISHSKSRFDTLQDALLALCETPRSFKQALRRCLDFWGKFPGELDFDHLLLLNVLRISHPDVLALIERNHKIKIEDIRENPAITGLDARKQDAVVRIIESLFSGITRTALPQGISAEGREEDHWRRFLAEPDLSVKVQHQVLFRDIQNADLNRLLDLLESPDRSEDAIHFLTYLRRDDVDPLFKLLVERRRKEDPARWPFSSSGRRKPPGLSAWIEVCRLGRTRDHLMGNFPWTVFAREVDACVLENLVFTDCVKNALVTRDFDMQGRDPEQNRALTQLGCSLRRHYSGRPDRLAAGLQHASPETLTRLCWQSKRGTPDQYPFKPWKGFAATILRAARNHPIPMIPQVAFMVLGDRDRDPDNPRAYQLQPSRAEALFGGEETVRNLVQGRRLEEWSGLAAQVVEALFPPAAEDVEQQERGGEVSS